MKSYLKLLNTYTKIKLSLNQKILTPKFNTLLLVLTLILTIHYLPMKILICQCSKPSLQNISALISLPLILNHLVKYSVMLKLKLKRLNKPHNNYTNLFSLLKDLSRILHKKIPNPKTKKKKMKLNI